MENPFILEPYRSKKLFCDRESETDTIIGHITNGRNVTLISPRRLGKTGLIFRVFEELKTRKVACETIYADVSDTLSLDDFISCLSEAIATKLKHNNKIASFFQNLRNVRPLLSVDPITGSPQVSFSFISDSEKQATLKEILNYLEHYPKMVVFAIDEFQQIREYEGVNMEAVLRKNIQHLHNVRFIYCGSKKHTMIDMFTNAKKPFYESTSFVFLNKLPVPAYSKFIIDLFNTAGKKIDEEQVAYIIEWTRDHTYYTQRLCNEVFALSGEIVEFSDIKIAIDSIFQAEIERFREIRRLITKSQWKMLKAIAEEGSVTQITSSAFLIKHGITSGATALRNVKALMDKELLLVESTDDGNVYSVYNIFLSRYLE